MSGFFKKFVVRQIGENKGARRIWLEGSVPTKGGFLPGQRYNVRQVKESSMLVLEVVESGVRVVSRKVKGEREIPVIDLNSAESLSLFEGINSVRVVVKTNRIFILPLASELRARERLSRLRTKLQNGESLSIGSLSHGGGVLSMALHEGLASSGVKSQLTFANEIRDDLMDHAEMANPCWDDDTIAVTAPMQEVAFDEWAMQQLPAIDICEAGIPCSGASVAGRAKRGLSHPEAHPDVGHLVVSFIAFIAKLKPAVVLLENVVPYQSSASMSILRSSLRDLGYNVQEATLDAGEFNTLEHRERMCMVATTIGMPAFDFASVARPAPVQKKLADVLEPIGDQDPRWSEMAGLKAKEIRDKEQGKSFAMQICTPFDTKVPTMTKGYAKVRSTDPKLQHPTDPNLLRQFSAVEHARFKDIPESLISGLCQTTAHELLGQSICFLPFRAVGEALGAMLHAFAKGSDEKYEFCLTQHAA